MFNGDLDLMMFVWKVMMMMVLIGFKFIADVWMEGDNPIRGDFF